MNASTFFLILLMVASFTDHTDVRSRRSKETTMAIDEGHFNVHTAEGSYRPFADLARAAGIRVLKHSGRFTPDALSKYDVLVIALARGAGNNSPLKDRGRPAFAEQEVTAIEEWVRRGGALLLILDHWPTGGAIAELAEKFHIDVTNGSTQDSLLFDDSLETIVFDRNFGSIGDHPILCGRSAAERIDRVATFTGSSLKGPAHSIPLLLFSRQAYDAIGPEKQIKPAWGRSQGIALEPGSGKVVVLAEAAMLRVFDIPSVQNGQLAKNVIAWLAGTLTSETAHHCN